MSASTTLKVLGHDNVHLQLCVNGERRLVSFAPYKTLLEVLREECKLTGTKHGCELGECGACAVIVDGEPVLSCLQITTHVIGKTIYTVEGRTSGPPPVRGGQAGSRGRNVKGMRA